MKPTYKVGAGAAAGGGGTGVNFRGNIAPAVAVDEEVDDEVDTPAPHMQVIGAALGWWTHDFPLDQSS